MKKNDMAALIIIVAIAGIISYIAANAFIGQPQNHPVQVEQMSPVSGTFPAPDNRVFNDKAIDPTVDITGGGQSATTPFANQ